MLSFFQRGAQITAVVLSIVLCVYINPNKMNTFANTLWDTYMMPVKPIQLLLVTLATISLICTGFHKCHDLMSNRNSLRDENLRLKYQIKSLYHDLMSNRNSLRDENLRLKDQIESLFRGLKVAADPFSDSNKRYIHKAISVAYRIQESPSDSVLVLKSTDEVLSISKPPVVVPTRLPSKNTLFYNVIDHLFVVGIRYYKTTQMIPKSQLWDRLLECIRDLVLQKYPSSRLPSSLQYSSHPTTGQGLYLHIPPFPMTSSPSLSGEPMFSTDIVA